MFNVPDYTLRYWEREFSQLRPKRTPSGQRLYSKTDIDLLKRIFELRYVKGLHVEAAKAYLGSTYRKCKPRNLPRIKNDTDAVRLLEDVKKTLEDAHLSAKIDAVIKYIGLTTWEQTSGKSRNS